MSDYEDLVRLTVRDIIQINGTVIAGALILLTIAGTGVLEGSSITCEINSLATAILVGIIVILFSISSMLAILSTGSRVRYLHLRLLDYSRVTMFVGFGYLILAMVLVAVYSASC